MDPVSVLAPPSGPFRCRRKLVVYILQLYRSTMRALPPKLVFAQRDTCGTERTMEDL